MQSLATVYFQGRERLFLNNIVIDIVGDVVAYDTWGALPGSTRHNINKYLKEYVHSQWESCYYAMNTIKETIIWRI